MAGAVEPDYGANPEYQSLVKAIAQGAILFVGAGSSCKAGYPAWPELLTRLEEEAKRIDAAKVATVEAADDVVVDGLVRASLYREVLGREAYSGILQTTFAPQIPPHRVEHESLVSMPFRHVLTTNYDGVLLSAHGKAFGSVAETFDADEWTKLSDLRVRQTTPSTPRSYVHLHGSIGRPDGIVLCKEDYDNRYHHERRFTDFLREFLVGQRVVFVGFSLVDEDLKYVLRQAEASVQRSGARHFALLAAPANSNARRNVTTNLQRQYGVEPIFFDNSSGDFEELWRLIERLQVDVAAEYANHGVIPAARLSQLLDELLPDHPNQRAVAAKRLPTIAPSYVVSPAPANIGGGSISSIDQEIDAVFALVSDGRPDEAIDRYERIRDLHGSELSPKHRYRIDANIGNAFYTKGEMANASKSYLQAVTHYRGSKDALAIEVFGFHLAGDNASALRLASELCASEPNFGRARSLWIRSHDDSTDLATLENQIPESLKHDPEVAMALADFARQKGDLESQVKYGRLAVAASPEWPDAMAMLGAAILAAEVPNIAFDAQGNPTARSVELLEEAGDVISKAIVATGMRDPAGHLAGMRYNRSVVRRALGDNSAAADDLREAFRLDPADPTIAVRFAMEAEGALDLDSAIEALEGMPSGNESGGSIDFAKAWALLRRKRSGDAEAAVQLVDQLCSRLDTLLPEPLRDDVARLGLRARVERGLASTGPAFIDSLPASALPNYQRTLLRARASFYAELKEEAREKASDAIREIGDGGLPFDRREVALLAQDCGLYADAVRLWQSVLPAGYAGPDTIHLVQAAYHANRWRTVLDVCEVVRAAGRTTRHHLQAEVAVLSASREQERAIKLLRGWVADHPDDKRMTLQMSAIALREGYSDIAVFDPARLPTVGEIKHLAEGPSLVYVLRRGPQPYSAFEAAYALYRRFPDEHDAQWTLVACVFDPSATPLSIDRPTRVAENAAVFVGRDGEPPHWVYVETAVDPVASRGERAPTHDFIQAMWGRAAGEEFEFAGHKYRVAQVENRILRRVHDIMESYEETFPDRALLRRFTPPAAAAPDAPIKEKLGEMYEVLERQDRNRQTLESMYRQQRLPIACFAKLYGRPVFDMVRYLANDGTLGVRADDGAPQRLEQAASAAASDKLVIDGTVLAGALVLGLLDVLAKIGPKLIVPQAVLDEIRKLSLDASKSRSHGAVGLHEGQFFFREASPEEIAREVEQLERVVEFIQKHCEVMGGEATLDLAPSIRERLEKMLDVTSIDAVALAVRLGCPLWTDDLGLHRLLAEVDLHLRTVWTQAIIKAAYAHQKISEAEMYASFSALLDRGYSFIRLSADDVVGVLKVNKWRVDRGAGRAVVRAASEVAFLNPHNAMITALALKNVWEQCPRTVDAKDFVLAVLKGLGEGRDKAFAKMIYRFPMTRRTVAIPGNWVGRLTGEGQSDSGPKSLTVKFDPFGDGPGKSLKRFLRAWRSRDGECRPRSKRKCR